MQETCMYACMPVRNAQNFFSKGGGGLRCVIRSIAKKVNYLRFLGMLEREEPQLTSQVRAACRIWLEKRLSVSGMFLRYVLRS